MDGSSEIPLHMQLRSGLSRVIDEHFEDGQQFWTEFALIEQLNLSRITVRRALDDLARTGVLQRQRRRGSFVSKRESSLHRRSIGAFIPEWNSDFLVAMLENLATVCAQDERSMHIYHTHKGEKVADALRSLEYQPQEESLLLIGNPRNTTLELRQTLHEKGYRLVTVETFVEGLEGSFVGIDNYDGIRLGVEYLADLGHQRIVFLVNEPMENDVIKHRAQAFQTEVDRRKLNGIILDCQIQDWNDSFESAYAKMPEVWAMEPRPTAIFTSSDPGAWAALKWLAENGVEVPGRVSVLGFDDARPSQFMHPGLTTIAHPLADIARRAIDILSDDSLSGKVELMAPKLVIRQSASGPPAGM